MKHIRCLFAVILAAAFLGVPAPAPVRAQDADVPDSLRALPKYVVKKPTQSSADLMTLAEIIARCTEGEKTKLSGHRDLTVTGTMRFVATWSKKREVTDVAFLAYQDDQGFAKLVRLGERHRLYKRDGDDWVYEKDGKESDIEVGVTAEGGEGLAELPFFLKDQDEFDFTLLERVLEGDHVIFKIGFRPRTDFKPLPSGVVYVDTDAYRIIHEEFTFDVQNPLPLLLKDVRRVTREWRELPTGEWVVGSIRADAELRGGWFGAMPERIEMGLVMDDYRFDQGYDEARFGRR